MIDSGYRYGPEDFATLLLRSFYPERPGQETAVIKAFLLAHLHEFDSVDFSVRVGTPIATDPTHLEGVQRNAIRSALKRIDILARRGSRHVIVEVKTRVTPAALGQILTYRQLLLEELPDALEPELVVVGTSADPDTVRVLQGHGITVYVYEAADAAGADAQQRV